MKKKILIIHPEGNINNNPNLSGIVEILCEQGYRVEIVSLRLPDVHQQSPCPGALLRLIDVPNFQNALLFSFVAPIHLFNSPDLLGDYLRQGFHGFDLVIGVDRGIIDASLISRTLHIPHGLISYEIFSEEEAGQEFKALEIEACRGLAFAVCQDRARASLLGRENKISMDCMLDIPVAGRGSILPSQKTFSLHDQFKLNHDTKIAAYIGSVTFPWSMISGLLDTLPDWPPDWVLLLHHRYGRDHIEELFRKFPLMKSSGKVYISPFQQLDLNDLRKILHEADLGLAFYFPMENNIFAGNNLRYIGMASGKIATYLQHGLPIMVNNIDPWNSIIKTFDIGCVIHNASEIPRWLQIFSEDRRKKCASNIPEFFTSHLDLNSTVLPLLERIRNLLGVPTV